MSFSTTPVLPNTSTKLNLLSRKKGYGPCTQRDSAVVRLCVSQADTAHYTSKSLIPWLVHAHFTFRHSKCAIEVQPVMKIQHIKSSRVNHRVSRATGELARMWRHACVTMPVAESCDHESWSERRSLGIFPSWVLNFGIDYWSVKSVWISGSQRMWSQWLLSLITSTSSRFQRTAQSLVQGSLVWNHQYAIWQKTMTSSLR